MEELADTCLGMILEGPVATREIAEKTGESPKDIRNACLRLERSGKAHAEGRALLARWVKGPGEKSGSPPARKAGKAPRRPGKAAPLARRRPDALAAAVETATRGQAATDAELLSVLEGYAERMARRAGLVMALVEDLRPAPPPAR